ncbi:short-chain dehydrogenase/reductase, partial [Rhizobium ruizarguesonis]
QFGGVAKLAAAVLELIESDNPPPQLLLGRDAFKHVSDRIVRLQQEIEAWKPVTLSTDG